MRVIEANVEFSRQFGRTFKDLDGSGFCELLHPSVREKARQQLARLIDGQSARFSERVVALRSGGPPEVFTGDLTGITVHGEAGQVESVMVLVRPENADQDGRVLMGRKKLLTDMDARILEGVAAGISTVQLAAMLYLSRGGVEYHVTALLRKLKVNNRPAMVSKAYSIGLLCVGTWPPKVLPDYVK